MALKKPVKAFYSKGTARREELLSAASQLLAEYTLDRISLKMIAERANIPVGSAYHFYSNAHEVFIALAQKFMATLNHTLQQPYTARSTQSWQALFAEAVSRAAEIYRNNPAYTQLIIGSKAPPEIKLADRDNDAKVGQLFEKTLSLYFHPITFPSHTDIFFFAVEIVDLMFSLSVIRHGEITKKMEQEAVRASIAYLREYLPGEMKPRKTEY